MTQPPAPNDMPETTQSKAQYKTAYTVARSLAMYRDDLLNEKIWKGDSGLLANIELAVDMLIKADLTAPVSARGEEERELRKLKSQIKTHEFSCEFMGFNPHGICPSPDCRSIEGCDHTLKERVEIFKAALQQPPASAVDLESLYKGNRHNETDYNQGWNDCIDHLAAQGIIKGVE